MVEIGEKKKKNFLRKIPQTQKGKLGMHSVINGIRIGTGVEGHRT